MSTQTNIALSTGSSLSSQQLARPLTGRLMALAAVTLWAAAYFWTTSVLAWLSPVWAAAARFGVAALILMVVAARVGHPWRTFRQRPMVYLILGTIGIGVFAATNAAALDLSSPVTVSVIMALTPVLTALGAAFVLGEQFGARSKLGMAIAVSGATIAVVAGNGASGLGIGWGALVALISAGCMAFYTVASRRLFPPDVPSEVSTGIVMVVGAVVLLPLIPFTKPPTELTSSGPVWSLLFLALGSTAAAYALWTRANRELGTNEPNLLYNAIPVLTMAMSALGGRLPAIGEVAGALVVIAGVTLGATHGHQSDTTEQSLTRHPR